MILQTLTFWRRHRRLVLFAGIAVMVLAAAARWPLELERALFREGDRGHDLRLRHEEVAVWFSGESIAVDSSSTYPPASYLVLWPAVGWLDLTAARWAWTATCIALLALLAWAAVRLADARDGPERVFLTAFFFSAYAPLVTIGNGQLTMHVLAALAAAFALARRESRADVWASSALFLVALVKPNVAAPFFWVFLFASSSWAPGVLTAAGYVLLTWV